MIEKKKLIVLLFRLTGSFTPETRERIERRSVEEESSSIS